MQHHVPPNDLTCKQSTRNNRIRSYTAPPSERSVGFRHARNAFTSLRGGNRGDVVACSGVRTAESLGIILPRVGSRTHTNRRHLNHNPAKRQSYALNHMSRRRHLEFCLRGELMRSVARLKMGYYPESEAARLR